MIRLNLVEVNAMPWIGTLMGLGAAIVCWVILPVAVYWYARMRPNTNTDSCGLPVFSAFVGFVGFGGLLWYRPWVGPLKFLALVVVTFVSVALIDMLRRKGETDRKLLYRAFWDAMLWIYAAQHKGVGRASFICRPSAETMRLNSSATVSDSPAP